nr:MAG TPA: hypothetical protein [Caudoviricetes sp.]
MRNPDRMDLLFSPFRVIYTLPQGENNERRHPP